jgi:hypothetical protein
MFEGVASWSVAGGMRRRGSGEPLYRRVAARAADTVGRTADTSPPDGGRHCWVLDSADREGVKRAGLLLEWRRSAVDGSWEGRVVYVAHLRADRWASVEEWLPATLLAPA